MNWIFEVAHEVSKNKKTDVNKSKRLVQILGKKSPNDGGSVFFVLFRFCFSSVFVRTSPVCVWI